MVSGSILLKSNNIVHEIESKMGKETGGAGKLHVYKEKHQAE